MRNGDVVKNKVWLLVLKKIGDKKSLPHRMNEVLNRSIKTLTTTEFFMRNGFVLLAAFIIVAAFFIRILGINFGLPYEHYWDEPKIISTALNIMKTGDYNPHFFIYPSLYIYLQLANSILCYLFAVSKGLLVSLANIQTCFDTGWRWEISHPIFFLWGRTLTVIFGAATVTLLYVMGRRLKDEKIGILAALFLTFSAGHVYYSKLITTDVPMAFFVTLSVYTSILSYQKRTLASFMLAGLLCGLTAATKYNGSVVLIVPVLSALLSTFRDKQMFFQRIGVVLLMFPFGFFIGCPYCILDLPTFLTDLGQAVRVYKLISYPPGHPYAGTDVPGFPQLLRYVGYFFKPGYGSILTLLAGVGIAASMFKIKRDVNIMLFSFPVMYMLLMCSQKHGPVRNMMAIFPFLAIFSSIGFLFLIDCFVTVARKYIPPPWLKWRIIVIVGLLIIVMGPPLVKSTRISWSLYKEKETRVVASEWLAENIPAGSKVLFMAQLHFYKPHIFNKQYTTVIDNKLNRPLSWYIENNVDYIVTSNARKRSWLKGKAPVGQFNAAFKDFSLIKVIPGDPLLMPGLIKNPMIKILMTPNVAMHPDKNT